MTNEFEPIGTAGTELTMEHLRAGIEHVKHMCWRCGGVGIIAAELFDQYMARVMKCMEDKGYVTVGDTMVKMATCPDCEGSGRDDR